MSDHSNILVDQFQRPIRDLRISITDRCNFRCIYCMPKEKFARNHQFLRRSELLSFEEIERIARVFAGLGVKKIRLTGGEPLVRTHLDKLINKISKISQIEDISLTTNASLLTRDKAQMLHDAGLHRINVSLDAMDDKTFKAINDVNASVEDVLQGIENASNVGIESVKVNMVVKKASNDHSILPMVRHFRGSKVILRFIEYMDVGNSNGWEKSEVVSAQEMVDLINAEFPLEPTEPNYNGEVAKRWRYKDGGGEIGIISSVTQPFCSSCYRIRLSAVGSLYNCLFATQGHDLRELIRRNCTEAELVERIAQIWRPRNDRYSELRWQGKIPTSKSRKIEMSFIGG